MFHIHVVINTIVNINIDYSNFNLITNGQHITANKASIVS